MKHAAELSCVAGHVFVSVDSEIYVEIYFKYEM